MARCRITKADVYRACVLCSGETSLDIAAFLGLFKDSLVSRYLGFLERDGLITSDNAPTNPERRYL